MKEYNYSDIVQLDKIGISFSDGYKIVFEECKRQWAEEHEISQEETLCVASRFLATEQEETYFLFYTKEKLKLCFKFKGFFRNKKSFNKFIELQMLLNSYGYSSFDMS